VLSRELPYDPIGMNTAGYPGELCNFINIGRYDGKIIIDPGEYLDSGSVDQ